MFQTLGPGPGPGRWSNVLLLLLVPLMLLVSSTARPPTVTYMTAVQHGVDVAPDLAAATTTIADISDSDDTPFTAVALTFAFPFAGFEYRVARLSPNGAMHFDIMPPCNYFFSAGPNCNFNGTARNYKWPGYESLVAGWLTDLNPSAHDNSSVQYTSTASRLVAAWDRVALYGSDHDGFTFGVELRPSGLIRLLLHSVADPADVADAPHWLTGWNRWLTGLRLNAAQLNRTVITAEQHRARRSFHTTGQGVYVRRPLLRNITRVDMCPVATSGYCLSPANGSAAGGFNVSVTSPLFGCGEAMAVWCTFAPLRQPAAAVRTSRAVVLSSNPGALTCAVPALDQGEHNFSLSALPHFCLDEPVHADDVAACVPEPLAIDQPSLRFVATAAPPPSADTTSCSSRDAHAVGEGPCGACGVGCTDPNLDDNGSSGSSGSSGGGCDGCDGGTAFRAADCLGVCGGGAVRDSNGVCCNQTDVDCLGQCYGSAEVRWLLTSSWCRPIGEGAELMLVACRGALEWLFRGGGGDGGDAVPAAPAAPVDATGATAATAAARRTASLLFAQFAVGLVGKEGGR